MNNAPGYDSENLLYQEFMTELKICHTSGLFLALYRDRYIIQLIINYLEKDLPDHAVLPLQMRPGKFHFSDIFEKKFYPVNKKSNIFQIIGIETLSEQLRTEFINYSQYVRENFNPSCFLIFWITPQFEEQLFFSLPSFYHQISGIYDFTKIKINTDFIKKNPIFFSFGEQNLSAEKSYPLLLPDELEKDKKNKLIANNHSAIRADTKKPDEKKIEGYILKYAKDAGLADHLLNLITDTYITETLASRPLLTDMIMNALPQLENTFKNKKEINIAGLYKAYTDLWIDNDDPDNQIKPRGKRAFLWQLARKNMNSPAQYFSLPYLQSALPEEKHFSYVFPDSDLLIKETENESLYEEINTIRFLSHDEENHYAFAHPSFAAYFLAEYYFHLILNHAERTISYPDFNKETKFFLKHIISSQKQHLQHLNLSNLDLEKINLSHADLTGANLQKVRLTEADLSEANCVEADLSKADLRRANLIAAHLAHAVLTMAELGEANLTKADLTEANLQRVNLSEADLTEANLKKANLNDAELMRANFQHSSLNETDFRWANLQKTNFSHANLSDINLLRANLSEANFTEANLQRANLNDADLTESIFVKSDLRCANFNKTNLSAADLSEADLTEANLWKANLQNAVLTKAILRKTNLIKADMRWADLSNADLSEADLWQANLNKADLTGAVYNMNDLQKAYLEGAKIES